MEKRDVGLNYNYCIVNASNLVLDKIWGGTICISTPHYKFLGTRPPVPVIYAHVRRYCGNKICPEERMQRMESPITYNAFADILQWRRQTNLRTITQQKIKTDKTGTAAKTVNQFLLATDTSAPFNFFFSVNLWRLLTDLLALLPETCWFTENISTRTRVTLECLFAVRHPLPGDRGQLGLTHANEN